MGALGPGKRGEPEQEVSGVSGMMSQSLGLLSAFFPPITLAQACMAHSL